MDLEVLRKLSKKTICNDHKKLEKAYKEIEVELKRLFTEVALLHPHVNAMEEILGEIYGILEDADLSRRDYLDDHCMAKDTIETEAYYKNEIPDIRTMADSIISDAEAFSDKSSKKAFIFIAELWHGSFPGREPGPVMEEIDENYVKRKKARAI